MAFVNLEAPMPDVVFPRLMLGVPNTIMTVEESSILYYPGP
jgi:hypothetical protein